MRDFTRVNKSPNNRHRPFINNLITQWNCPLGIKYTVESILTPYILSTSPLTRPTSLLPLPWPRWNYEREGQGRRRLGVREWGVRLKLLTLNLWHRDLTTNTSTSSPTHVKVVADGLRFRTDHSGWHLVLKERTNEKKRLLGISSNVSHFRKTITHLPRIVF